MKTKTTTNAETSALLVGREVVMTSRNSNWEVGEVGVVLAYWPREERLAVAFAGRGDDLSDEHAGYTAALADCMDMAHPSASALVSAHAPLRR